MRKGGLTASVALTVVALSGFIAAVPALAQTYTGTPLSPPALQESVVKAVADRLQQSPTIVISDLAPSLARNGHGYCGKVSADAGAPAQPFHVILDEDGSAAVLILPAKGDPPGLSREDATQLLTNFGCIR